MNKKSKGISPLVASIMLIAFTITVGGIFFGWVTQFSTHQRTMIERCSNANVLIQRVGYEASDNSMMLVIYNMGGIDMRFDVLLEYSNTDIHPQMIEKYPVQINVGANTIKTYNLTSPYDNGEENVSITDDIISVAIQSAD